MNKTNFLAGLMIVSSLLLAVFSVKDDAITTDESPHITAGYSYLTQKDMRLNPEHPPLIKDIAAAPLLFQKINFDANHPSWKTNINDQWSAGPNFLYDIGNDPDKIAFAARLAVMIFLALLGIMVFIWAREKYGDNMALVALALTVFSPNIIANGRYVTTDVGATFAFVIAFYFLAKFLKTPSWKNIIFAGLAFGLAQLIKFSLVLLVPLYIFIIIASCFVKPPRFNMARAIKSVLAIFVIGYLLVWPVYQYHVWNYPIARQKNDAAQILSSYPIKPIANTVVWMTEKPILRPYAQYLLGVLMVSQRAAGGNTAYFQGDISATAWKSYFPTVYLLKEPIPVLALILIVLIVSLAKFRLGKILARLKEWIGNNIDEFIWITFVVFYWFLSIKGNLNIGLRHVLPTFPFIYLLTVGQIKKWLASSGFLGKPLKILLIGALTVWYIAESALTFPYYLAYFNELAGGPANGYKRVVDSNLDWGQDLKRLTQYVEKNGIDKIKLDYFGGGSPQYYLGDRYEKLEANNLEQRNGWIAVSATLLQNGRGIATKGFDGSTTHYNWLNQYEPVAKIGYSIFVYRVD